MRKAQGSDQDVGEFHCGSSSDPASTRFPPVYKEQVLWCECSLLQYAIHCNVIPICELRVWLLAPLTCCTWIVRSAASQRSPPSVECFQKKDCSQLAAPRAAAFPIRETDERWRHWDVGCAMYEEQPRQEDAPEGRIARPSDPSLAPGHVSGEHDLVWGGYIDSSSRGQPMCKEGIDKIKCEVNDFHFEHMNSPPQTSSLQYWAQASLKYPIMAQAARRYLCIPTSSATSECSFSKLGYKVKARWARLSNEHMKELSFLCRNQYLMY